MTLVAWEVPCGPLRDLLEGLLLSAFLEEHLIGSGQLCSSLNCLIISDQASCSLLRPNRRIA
jgi:hypothetical protein